MIIDNTHQKWITHCAEIAAVATAAYLVYLFLAPGGPSGGSVTGLAFGFAGTSVIIFECLLSLRKKYPASPLGRVQTWMRAHIWLGLLSALLILFHSGFHWGRGLAAVLMWMFTIITMSGIYGLLMQNYLPRRMTDLVKRETVFEQIPEAIRTLRAEATERVEFLIADAGPEVAKDVPADLVRAGGRKFHFDAKQKKANAEKVEAERHRRKEKPQIPIEEAYARVLKARYLQHVRPFLDLRPAPSVRRLFADAPALAAYFTHLRRQMPLAAHDVLKDLEEICEERRQLAVQERLHRWLHLWLYAHVPISMAFLVLILVHAVVSLRY